MPNLTQRTKTKLTLPVSSKDFGEDCWIECYKSAQVADYIGLQTQIDALAASADLLARIITDWNFTDETGAKAPITAENIRKLPIEDLAFIGDALGLDEDAMKKRLSDAKKNSLSNTSAGKKEENLNSQEQTNQTPQTNP